MSDENKTLTKYVGEKAWIIFRKSYVFTTKEVIYSKDNQFISVERENIDLVKVNLKEISCIDYSIPKKSYRVSYNIPAIVFGEIKAINSKFLEIEVTNTQKENYKYMVLVPIKGIEGIKFEEKYEDEI